MPSELGAFLNKEQSEADKRSQELNTIRSLQARYPDLEQVTHRWKKETFSTTGVNNITTDVDIRHSCGCCPDSPIEAFPYAIVEGVKLYSKPSRFCVGEKYEPGFGELASTGWADNMRKEGIAEAVIIRVQEFFDKNPPEDCEDDDE